MSKIKTLTILAVDSWSRRHDRHRVLELPPLVIVLTVERTRLFVPIVQDDDLVTQAHLGVEVILILDDPRLSLLATPRLERFTAVRALSLCRERRC